MKSLFLLVMILSQLAMASSVTFIDNGGGGGGGITSLNGLTGATQVFANGSTGLAPAFSSVGTTHTLNIPLASGAGVTAGVISKADYDSFNGKLPGGTFGANTVIIGSGGNSVQSSTLSFGGGTLSNSTDSTYTVGTSTTGRPTKYFGGQQVQVGNIATFAGSIPLQQPTASLLYVAANAGNSTIAAESFLGSSNIALRDARGTNTAPLPLLTGDTVGGTITFAGWDGVSAFSAGFALTAIAMENWSATARGTRARIETTIPGQATRSTRIHFGEGAYTSIETNNNFYCFTDGTCDQGQATDNRFRRTFTSINQIAGTPGTNALSGSVLFANTQGFGAVGNNNAGIQSDTYGVGVSGEFAHFHARGTNTAPTAIQQNDSLGQFSTAGFNGSSWQLELGRRNFAIQAIADENFTTSAMGTRVNLSKIKLGTITQVVHTQWDGTGNMNLINGTNAIVSSYTNASTQNVASSFIRSNPTYPQYFASSNTAGPSFIGEGYGANSLVVGPRVTLRMSRGTNTAPTATQNNDTLGSYLFGAYDGTAFVDNTRLLAQAAETWSATNHGTQVYLTSTKNGSGQVQQVRYYIDGLGEHYTFGNAYFDTDVSVTHGANVGSSGLFAVNAPYPANDGLLQVGSEGGGVFPASIVEFGSATGNPAHTNYVYSPDGSNTFSSSIQMDETTYNLGYVTSGTAFDFHSGVVIDNALSTKSSAVALTADNQVVDVATTSFVLLTSDDTTPANRTFTLSNCQNGQHVILKWNDGTNAGELLDTGTTQLNGDWSMTGADNGSTISLICDGTNIAETGRSDN